MMIYRIQDVERAEATDCCYKGKIYLPDDKKRLANLLEYCDRYAMRNYNTAITKALFAEKFMTSYIRSQMDIGHPKLMGQAAEDTFQIYVDYELNGDIGTLYRCNDQGDYAELELYWIGQMYAYIHCMTRLSSSEIYQRLPLQEMRHFYVTCHEMGLSAAFEKLSGAFGYKD